MVSAAGSASASISLGPLSDSGSATRKDSSGGIDNCVGDVVEDDVLEEEGAGEEGAFGSGGLEESGGVGDDGVKDGLSADGLSWRILLRATGVDLEADTAVVEGNTLEGPAPVPESVDTSGGVVDSDVSDSELLVTDPDTEFL